MLVPLRGWNLSPVRRFARLHQGHPGLPDSDRAQIALATFDVLQHVESPQRLEGHAGWELVGGQGEG